MKYTRSGDSNARRQLLGKYVRPSGRAAQGWERRNGLTTAVALESRLTEPGDGAGGAAAFGGAGRFGDPEPSGIVDALGSAGRFGDPEPFGIVDDSGSAGRTGGEGASGAACFGGADAFGSAEAFGSADAFGGADASGSEDALGGADAFGGAIAFGGADAGGDTGAVCSGGAGAGFSNGTDPSNGAAGDTIPDGEADGGESVTESGAPTATSLRRSAPSVPNRLRPNQATAAMRAAATTSQPSRRRMPRCSAVGVAAACARSSANAMTEE